MSVDGPISLEIIQSHLANPITNIQFIYPDHVNSYQNQTFHSQFLDFLNDFSVIRMMDWLRTNNSTVSNWSDRSKKNYYTQALHTGVAWEYIIELANLTQKNIWINIPHLATDNYIDSLATMLYNNLNQNINIYIEYSNETWNSIFSQNSETALIAEQIGFTGDPWVRTWKYTAKRSADIFQRFEDVFGTNNNRLIKTIPTQSVNTWLTNEILTYFNDPLYNPTGVQADAIAIAPYFAGSVADQIGDNNEVASITVPEIIERMETSLAENLSEITANVQLANEHNLRLLCYEAGQHLVATGSHVNNDDLTIKLNAANAHEDLREVYCHYFNQWYESASDLMMHFSSHGNYSKWGSWGIKRTMDDLYNPKYLALRQCVFHNNEIAASINEITNSENQFVFPNPATHRLNHSSPIHAYAIRTLDGKTLLQSNEEVDYISIDFLSKGMYLVTINSKSYKFLKE